MPVTVSARGVLQSRGVKVSDAGATRIASVAPVPSGPRGCGVRTTSPPGTASSTTVQVAVPPASATVTAVSETVTPAASSFVTVTVTAGAGTAP